MEALHQWLNEGPTPVLWVAGPASIGKTFVVQNAVLAASSRAVVLRLDAYNPDRALAEALLGEHDERLTTRRLLQLAADRELLVLDGIDALQQHVGPGTNDITDCRFRQLLLSVCEGALRAARIVVTSRLTPPSLLPNGSLTILDLPQLRRTEAPAMPADGTLERRVLEFAALGRRAIDAATIQRMGGIDERLTQQALNKLADGGLVNRVGRDSYQVSEVMRSAALPDPTRGLAVRTGVVQALHQRGTDPERLLDLLVDLGRVDEAVQVYWRDLGNFSRLHPEGRDHLGASLCRRLNSGLGPEEVSPALLDSGGAWAVMNDWSQFARCYGDAATFAVAASSAYRVLPEDQPPWDAARLAAHVGEAYVMTGSLVEAMRWCERSWDHAREGMRLTQGVATREVIDAYDWSANTMAKIYLRLGEPAEIRRLIEDLFAIHEYARQSIAEFNAGSVVPLSGPSGQMSAEQLADGRLSAMLALAEGEFAKLEPRPVPDAGRGAEKELGILALRAKLAIGSPARVEAVALRGRLLRAAEAEDDCAADCELATLAEATIDDAAGRLATADAYLPQSAACGLGLWWRDLQLARARALQDLGRNEEAGGAAESSLVGTPAQAGAQQSGDWVVGREAASLLASLGRSVPDRVHATLDRAAPPHRRSPPKPTRRRQSASSGGGTDERLTLHAAAVRVLKAYETEGTPFALNFRHFGIEVLHGPFELGPKLIENALRDALPPEVEVLTVQDHSSMAYGLESTRFSRDAPALLLEDEQWVGVVRGLIPFADLIVSEPLMLSEGVRLELQMIHESRRGDRTVLVLPPPESVLATIDHDALVQMFPRCLWADSLHQQPLEESPLITDLLERMRSMARLPVEVRRGLRDPQARDEAFPIDLSPIAEHLEREAELASIFQQDDPRTRYYAFWQMLRAGGIRAMAYQRGDRSAEVRCRMARSNLEMSNIMLDHSTEGDKVILQGDPAQALLLARSAWALLQGIENDMLANALRAQAEQQVEQLERLQQIMADRPERFEIRLRYGPLVLRKA